MYEFQHVPFDIAHAHNCSRNHVGSARSMEATLAIHVAKECMDDGLYWHTTCHDDDSSLRANLGDGS